MGQSEAGSAAAGSDDAPHSDTDSSADDRTTRSMDLVRLAQSGDQSALNELFGRYYPRVRRIVGMRLGRQLRNRLDSEDIAQRTFIGAVRAFDRFEMRDELSLLHWLGKIAEHQIRDAADYHHAQKRDSRRDVALVALRDAQESGEIVFEPEEKGLAPLENLVKSEDSGAVLDALGQLRDRYREVIIVRQYEGSDWSTVAEIVGVSTPDAARMLYARAVAELSKIL
ncbi:MAG: RNA polymerase sigma-70 factor (subfamily 1) [Pseudohongiellaceae bacterium]|jgi:RNA polymerase sigma-70 factor (subfamily 1)